MNGFGTARVVLALFALGLGSGAATAQQTAENGRVDIQGRVLDGFSRRPLEGVAVLLPEFGVDIRTDSTGLFTIRGIPLGTYELSLSLPGYRTASGGFAVMRSGSFITTLTPSYASTTVDEETPLTGFFVGRIVDGENGRPVEGAEIQVLGMYLGAATNQDGRFRIDGVPEGQHVVEFSQLGYAPRTDTIRFAAGQTSDARVQLARDPIEIEPIEVTVERREMILQDQGFYERRDRGYGSFLDLDMLRQRRPEQLTDAFTGLPGVQVMPGAFNALERQVLLRGGRTSTLQSAGGACYPILVIDGLLRHGGGTDPTLPDLFVDPNDVAGVEIYPSQTGVPIQYSRDAACGAILIWTRQTAQRRR